MQGPVGYGLGSDQTNRLNYKRELANWAPFMALEPRFCRQNETPKNGESKPTSYSWAGMAYYSPLPQKGISPEIRHGQKALAILAV